MRALLLLALVGCYAPTINRGAPCDVDTQCPSGQACIDHRCGGGLGDDDVDAASTIDGPIAKDDPDGDGIASMDDNCPQLANADQGNEDGDKFGDACDPCPVEANNAPSDPDMDGVADGCDPRPNMAGDKLVVFGGFHAALPATWTTIGTATIGNDEATLTVVANNHTAIVAPGGPFANGTVSASIIVDMQVGNLDSAASLTMPYDPQDDQGIFCELYAPNAGSTANRSISLWDSPAQQERGRDGFSWTTAVKYRVSLARNGSSYSCVLDNGGMKRTANGNSGSNIATAKAAVAAYGANFRVQWMMVVTSP